MITKEYILDLIENYHTSLSKKGSAPKSVTENIFKLTFIQQMLSSNLGLFIGKDELNTINEYVYSLFGSDCLIQFPEEELPINNSDNIIIVDNISIRLNSNCKPIQSNGLIRIN